MRFLVAEKLGPHKFKTPEGYLICTDAILSRTGKQEYKRCELFGDACEDPDKIVNVDRTDAEVFSDKAMASFENKPVCIEHPDHDVNAENHNELAVGFVRDIHKGEDNGKPVMMGTLVITNKDAVEAIESGEYKELSCGYDCDINDDDNLQQRNIRGNHVALCKQGRAGIARIVDSVNDLTKFKMTLRNISKMYSNDPGIEYVMSVLKNLGYEVTVDSIDGWKENKNVPGEHIKQYRMNVMLEGREHHFLVQLYADMGEWKVKEINAYMLDSNIKQGDSMKDELLTDFDVDELMKYYTGKNTKRGSDIFLINGKYTLNPNVHKERYNTIAELEAGEAKHHAEMRKGYAPNDPNQFGDSCIYDTGKWYRVAYYTIVGNSTNNYELFVRAEGYSDAKAKAAKAAKRIHRSEKICSTFDMHVSEVSEQEAKRQNPSIVFDSEVNFSDSAQTQDSKERLFTIEYKQDDVMYIRKVRANSIEDAISKVKDDAHKVVVFTNQVLNELGKNNSIGKYDRVVQAMRSLYSESLLPDDKLKELIRKKVPEYIKKYVKE